MRKIVRRLIRYYLILKNRKNNNIINLKTCIDNKTIFEDHILIKKNVNLLGSRIGRGTYLAGRDNLEGVFIGRFCSISTDVSIVDGNHPSDTFISTHPAFYSTVKHAGFTFVKKDKFEEFRYVKNKYKMEIGNDVWIGTGVLIKAGVKIGDGAIIGAGALVTKDVEPYAIYGGVPAKKIRMRFNEEEVQALLKSKWWENDMKWLQKNADNFKDFGEFVSSR